MAPFIQLLLHLFLHSIPSYLRKDMSPPVRPSRGGGRPFSVECCPLRLAALGRPSQMTNVQDGESELLSPQNLSPNYHSLATNGNHQQGGFASFSAAGGILGGALPDPGKSQSFLDNLTFTRLTGGLQPKLVSAGWVLGLGRNCPPVAAALTHWARTRGLWQRSHHWHPQRPTTTHHPPRRCSAGAQHPCPGGNPRKWVGIEQKSRQRNSDEKKAENTGSKKPSLLSIGSWSAMRNPALVHVLKIEGASSTKAMSLKVRRAQHNVAQM